MVGARKDFKNLIGKRVLVSSGYGVTLREVVVLEVSPDGEFVKLRYESGNTGWEKVSKVNVECVLGESRADDDKLKKERKELLRKVCSEIEVLISDAYDDRKSTDYIDGLKRAWERVEELLEMEK